MLNKRRFISSQEGKVFIVGVLLLFGYAMSIIGMYIVSAKDANKMLIMTFTNFFFGRAAGISYGFTVEFSDSVIIFMNTMIEFITVMLVYPLFVLSWNKSLTIDFLKDFFTKVEEQKVKYKDFFAKYGKYGLFLFVWFPFWMTGPVIGAIIGFLIGIKHYTTIAIVLSGTFLAIIIWTYFLKELVFLLNQLSSNATYIVLGIFVIIAVVLKLIKSRK